MIASISGLVQETGEDHAVVELGGVGLKVYLPAPTLDQLRVGDSVFLFTHLVVREDGLTLFGFETKEWREIFVLLLGVNGIGPRLALAVLSTLNPEAIRRAVFNEQVEVIARVPGIGRKTAQKVLLHLQDRLPVQAGLEQIAPFSDVDGEVISALTALGYSVVEAQSALQTVPRDAPQDLESRLRLALRYFARP